MVTHAKESFVFHGTIVNSHTLEIIGYEPGEHAWVARQVWVRQQALRGFALDPSIRCDTVFVACQTLPKRT